MLIPLLLLLPQDSAEFSAETARIAADLKAHVQYLADEELAGRESGSPGATLAEGYIAKTLKDAGLKPAGENGTWFQEFEIKLPPEPGRCYVELSGPEPDHSAGWEAVGTVIYSSEGAVEAPVVAVQYGILDDEAGTYDMPPSLVKGKIVLMRRYTPGGKSDDARQKKLGDLRTKIRNAAEAGAVGVILGAHPADAEKAGEATIPFDAARGTGTIPVITVNAGIFGYFENWVLNARGEVMGKVEVSIEEKTAKTRNVLAMHPGKTDTVIVMGAHYDHLGHGGPGSLAPGSNEIHNGADDNASGTSVLIEMAQWAVESNRLGESTLVFAFWSAEEMGLLGSQHWVENPTVDLTSVLCNVNLDMVGRPTDGKLTVGSVQTAAAFSGLLDGMTEGLSDSLAADAAKLEFQRMGGNSAFGGSDHMSFHSVSIPALFLFSGLHEDYHKPTDDWEKLDYDRMAVLVQILGETFHEVEGIPNQGDFAYVAPPARDPHAGAATISGGGAWFGSIPDYGATPEGGGMQISGTSPGGPAEKAGLVKGDVIKKIADDKIVDIYDFMDALAKHSPGDTIDVVIVRGGKEQVVKVLLSSRG